MKRVLIIEDDIELLTYLREGIESSGYEVEVSQEGKDGLNKVESFLPDIIVLDINLPDMSGLDILEKVKRTHPNIGVVLATGKDRVEDIKKGYEYQADFYVTKPYKLSEIIKNIKIFFSLSV